MIVSRMRTLSSYLLPFLFLTAGCNQRTSSPREAPVLTGMEIAEAKQLQTAQTVTVSGTVHASESAVLSTQISGRILSILVKEGDSVQHGQTLLAIDGAQYRADASRTKATAESLDQEVRMAEAEATLATSTVKRYELLQSRKSVSPQEFDEISKRAQATNARLASLRAQAVAAKANVESARVALGYTQLRAPFSGIVTARHADPGTLALPASPLLEIDREGGLQLWVTIDETLLAILKKGLTVDVQIPSQHQTNLKGIVEQIQPDANTVSHSFLIKLSLPQSTELHAGVYGTAQIVTGTKTATYIPQTAILSNWPDITPCSRTPPIVMR